MKTAIAIALGGLLAAALVACSGGNPAAVQKPVFYPADNPAKLSAWGMMDWSDQALSLNPGVVPYDLNSPLFSDYAGKLRTIWLPPGAAAGRYREADYPDFPVGTVITKTFYYQKGETAGAVLDAQPPKGRFDPVLETLNQVHLVETRLLVHRDQGWDAVSYVWNHDQSDAILTRIGDVKPLTLSRQDGANDAFAYIVPDSNQCAGCHAPNNTSRKIVPLGIRPRHIDKPYQHNGDIVNQLQYLQRVGYLSGYDGAASVTPNADWNDTTAPIDFRARSYLDINCSHCHNPVGPADTSGLDLTMAATSGPELGICKLPIAAGSGTGGRAFGIVPGAPDESILLYRLETVRPGAMMPELGRSLAHAEGVELIRDWIADMTGDCSV